jgi:hypothetical protein
MVYIVAIAVILGVLWYSMRANELFCVSFRNGRSLVVRGHIPATLLNDFRDVLAAPPVASATLRAYRDKASARLAVAGVVDDGQKQRLRNVFNVYPMSNLRTIYGSRKRTLTQMIGVIWLAWLVDSFSSR